MKILMINQEMTLPPLGYGGRSYYFSRCLTSLGHECTLVNGRHSHLKKTSKESPRKTNLISVPVFPYKNSKSKVRILNWFIFSAWLIFLGVWFKISRKKFDVVYYSSPQLISALSALAVAKICNARFVFEFRDIWPLTLISLGKYDRNNFGIRLMAWIEKKAVEFADLTVSSLPGGETYIQTNGFKFKDFLYLRSGISRIEFDAIEQSNCAPLSLDPTKFNVVYAGSHGLANNLSPIIEAAWKLKDSDNVVFHLIGDGEDKPTLVEKAKGLENVIFYPSVTKETAVKTMQVSQCVLLSWNESPLYDYGTSANKIFEYMASGSPIINMYSGAFDIIKEYDCGLTIPSNDVEGLVAGINLLKNDGVLRKKFANNAFRAVKEKFLYERNAEILVEELNEIVN